MWEGTSIYVSEEDEELGCGDGAEVDRGVRGDRSFISNGREEVSEEFNGMP